MVGCWLLLRDFVFLVFVCFVFVCLWCGFVFVGCCLGGDCYLSFLLCFFRYYEVVVVLVFGLGWVCVWFWGGFVVGVGLGGVCGVCGVADLVVDFGVLV